MRYEKVRLTLRGESDVQRGQVSGKILNSRGE